MILFAHTFNEQLSSSIAQVLFHTFIVEQLRCLDTKLKSGCDVKFQEWNFRFILTAWATQNLFSNCTSPLRMAEHSFWSFKTSNRQIVPLSAIKLGKSSSSSWTWLASSLGNKINSAIFQFQIDIVQLANLKITNSRWNGCNDKK